jgi:hypothetical protein
MQESQNGYDSVIDAVLLDHCTGNAGNGPEYLRESFEGVCPRIHIAAVVSNSPHTRMSTAWMLRNRRQ